jgi:hypothetical protein
MKKIRFSLFYLAGYLSPAGAELLFAPLALIKKPPFQAAP